MYKLLRDAKNESNSLVWIDFYFPINIFCPNVIVNVNAILLLILQKPTCPLTIRYNTSGLIAAR